MEAVIHDPLEPHDRRTPSFPKQNMKQQLYLHVPAYLQVWKPAAPTPIQQLLKQKYS